MHNLSSRYGVGSKISVLEVTTPRDVTEGVEYYLNSEGNMFSEGEMLPVVMLPRVGGSVWLSMPANSAPTVHQYGANAAPGAATASFHSRMPLTAPYAMYLHYATAGVIKALRAVVMNEETGELIAESVYDGYVSSSNYLMDPIGYTYTGLDKVGVLCGYTTNTETSKSMRVVEFTFTVGTLLVTNAAKTPIASATAAGYDFVAAGADVSLGKIAVITGASPSVVNLVANTVNSASGLTGPNCQVEGKRVLTLGATNSVTVADLETNGSSSFTATGASWTGTPNIVVRLHPRVYLVHYNLTTANALRLLVVNETFTAGVISVINNPILADFVASPVVIQQRTGSPVFYLVEAASTSTASAVSLAVASDGTILQHAKPLILAESVVSFVRNLVTTASGRKPFVLDVPVVTEISAVQHVNTPTADSYATWFVKFRADVMLGLYNPVYFGRALADAVQGALATFASSPALLSVEPTQTQFQRVGRVIKVNDLQGFFLMAANYNYGINTAGKTGTSDTYTFGIDESSLNYPIVFGQAQAVKGNIVFTVPYSAASGSYNVAVVTPLGADIITVGTNNTDSAQVDVNIQFTGFAVVGIRIQYNDTINRVIGLTYDVEALDYV